MTCTTCDLANHTSYNPSSSSTFQNLSSTWSILYADGAGARGYAASDDISFGSGSALSTSLNFGVATLIGGTSFSDSMRSGVMGLGQDGMATMPGANGTLGKTLFSRLVRSGSLNENILSVRLDKGVQREGKVYKEGTGAYTFGAVEDGYIAGGRSGLHWAPVTSANYW
jgi:cathepsin D